MDYDFRNKTGPMHRPATSTPATSSGHHPMYGYPSIGQQPTGYSFAPPPPGRHHPTPPSSSPGTGIRVMLKPEYRITPPPQLSPQIGDIPRSNFQFDFDFERKVLAEAEKERPDWSKLVHENPPPRPAEIPPSQGSTTDHVVRKYITSGLSREAVPLAVANFGDDPIKVREFSNGYTLLREMGFSSNSVAEALLMYDNDTDKAVAHFLNGSS
ncbi:uncharacterized protein LOC141693036 isoform X2 [Apium graveolens]|uniref:uncharacterized protein LOC141693036 isoform X2 n=1 Tax=Apium graveolens TaxID=4045 RepID=UPI003D799CE7